jgi:hypothetical protein
VRGLLHGWWKKTKKLQFSFENFTDSKSFQKTFRDPKKTAQDIVGGFTYPCIERGMDKKITNDRGESHGYHI